MNAGLALLIIDYPQANPKELRAAREYIRATPQEQYEEEIAATITLLRAIGNAETFTDPLTGMLCVNAIDTDDIVFKAFAMRAMPSAPESAPDAKPAPPTEGSATVATGIEDRLRVLNAPPVAPTDEETLGLAKEALRRLVEFKPFWRKFDHCGAMNATQLGERDLFLAHMKKAKEVLSRPAPPVAPVRVTREEVDRFSSFLILESPKTFSLELSRWLRTKGVIVDGEEKP